MKRFLAMILISVLLFSCSTTGDEGVSVSDEISDTAVTVSVPEEQEAVIETVVMRDESLPGPVAERPERDRKTEEKTEEAKQPPATEPRNEKPVKEEPQAPQLTGRELANEITSKIERDKGGEGAPAAKPQEKEAPKAEAGPVPAVKAEVPPSEEPSVEEKAAGDVPSEKMPVPPAPEKEEPVVKAEPVPPAEPEKEAEVPVPQKTATEQPTGPLDHEMSEGLFSGIIKLVMIIVLFTLASVIRSKYNMPLPWPVALVLSVLLAAVPMLTSSILEGWSLWQLSYLSILLTFFVFRQKNRK